MKQKLIELKEETENAKIIVGKFNTPLTVVDTTTREKINKEIEYLNNKKVTDIHRALCLTAIK